MPDQIGNITVPDIAVSGTFPIVAGHPFGRSNHPDLAIHQFGSGNVKIEQRFLLGAGAKRFTVRRTWLRDADRRALRDFWESKYGPYGAFIYNAPNDDGNGTTVYTCRFANEPLSWEMLADHACSLGVTLIEIPASNPTYTLSSTVTRFPPDELKDALLSQVQQMIPLIKIQPLQSGYPAIYLSDRRCTIGAQLYLPRLVDFDGISQGMGNEADDATFTFGNADRVMRDLANDVDLFRATIEFSLYHVGQQIKLDLWKGDIINWQFDSGAEFKVTAADGLYELNLPYPSRKVSRACWKAFNIGACPFATAGAMDLVHFPSADSSKCDKGYDTANGCLAHGMKRYYGAVIAEPQGVTIKDNSTGVFGFGRSSITSVSLVSDSIYDQVIPEIYTDSEMPVNCKVAAGRDESDFYEALGIVGEGPIISYTAAHYEDLNGNPVAMGSTGAVFVGSTLDGQAQHGWPNQPTFGIRQVLGADPAANGDWFSLEPSAWHLWQLQKLGFKGHADVYMGVFWNNKRRRISATYPYATVVFSGAPVAGDVVSFSIGGTTINHAIGYGETLQGIVSDMRAIINGLFAGAWADDNFGSSATLRIQSKAPAWTYTGVAVSAPNSVTLTLTNNLGATGVEGDWEMIDAVSPVMTEGARNWIRDLASEFQAAGIKASFAFSMECYLPPATMRAKYLSYTGGVVSPGADVDLGVPSHQMHFGTRVRTYLRQMYKECADQIAAAGLPVVLQFGETQWWYFDNKQQDPNGGMPYYDSETISDFAAAKGHQVWPFRANTDDPAGDPAHPTETADFLRDRIWAYCQDVITYVRSYHPTAVFECLWPLDANQGAPKPSAKFRALNFYVNLPSQWKNSSYGIKYFRCEGFDYDVWQKNSNLMRQAITFATTALARPASECMFLGGLYGPPDPPMAQAYGLWLPLKLYSFCYWAFDQFCLNSRPIPLEIAGQMQVTGATYYKPLAARAMESVIAVPVGAVAGGALNRFEANTRKCNG